MSRRRRLTLLSGKEAIARIEDMMPLIKRDIDIATYEYATLEAGNAIVRAKYQGVHFAGATTYSVIHQTLGHSLSLRVAKLLEVPTARSGGSLASALNRSDLASMPLLLRLANQERCRKVYAALARNWNPHLRGIEATNERQCLAAIDRALKTFSEYKGSSTGKRSLAKLRDFRNHVLAHNLLAQASEHIPTYDQVFGAFRMALAVWQQLRFAIAGENWDLDLFMREREKEAERFWEPALRSATYPATKADG